MSNSRDTADLEAAHIDEEPRDRAVRMTEDDEKPPVLTDVQLDAGAPTLASFVPKTMEQLQQTVNGKIRPVPVPWPRLAHRLDGGLWRGLTILVGSTGTGRTQFAIQIVKCAASEGIPVLYLSFDTGLTGTDLCLRMLEAHTQTPVRRLAKRIGKAAKDGSTILESDLEQLRAADDRFDELPLELVRTVTDPEWEKLIEAVAERILELHSNDAHPALLVVDFLQVMGMARPEAELRRVIGELAYRYGKLAEQLNVAVLCISSTARGSYARQAGRDKDYELGKSDPSELVGSGKESGEIEYAAPNVLVLCRKRAKDRSRPADDQHWLAIAKFREGTEGWVPFRFHGTHFDELPDSDSVRKV